MSSRDRDWRVRLEDMLEATERAIRYGKDLSREQAAQNDQAIDAIARNLEILGEAVRKLPPSVTKRHPEIPWSKIAEMRNLLIHEYHSIAPEWIFDTVLYDLPPLLPQLRALLAQENGE